MKGILDIIMNQQANDKRDYEGEIVQAVDNFMKHVSEKNNDPRLAEIAPSATCIRRSSKHLKTSIKR